jgi:hypothetical protein
MKKALLSATIATALAAGSAHAAQTLQMDVNAIGIQTLNGAGAPSAFGGLTHTGTVNLNYVSNITYMAGVFIDGANQNFNGTLTGFAGTINMTNGQVTGGSLLVTINSGGDTYSAQVSATGHVEAYVGGGFKIEGLTFNGLFSDNQFGNVNVAPWAGGGLPGSFLQFNFNPNASGGGFADMDLFVNVVPLPPAALTGLAGLAGLAILRRRR